MHDSLSLSALSGCVPKCQGGGVKAQGAAVESQLTERGARSSDMQCARVMGAWEEREGAGLRIQPGVQKRL